MKKAKHEYVGIIFRDNEKPVVMGECFGRYVVVPEQLKKGGYKEVYYEDDNTITIRILRKTKLPKVRSLP